MRIDGDGTQCGAADATGRSTESLTPLREFVAPPMRRERLPPLGLPPVAPPMPTPEQLARLARVLAGIRTAKETLPAINHGPNAVPAERIARASALLDRMHRAAVLLADAAPGTEQAPVPGRSDRQAA